MASFHTWKVTEPYIKMSCGLGEAPFHERDTNALRFFDIVNEELHIVDLKTGPSSLKSHNLGTPVSTSAEIEGTTTEVIVGAKEGYALMNRETKALSYVKKVWEARDGPGKAHRMRFNDGAIDPQGRYWAGTMNDPKVREPSPEGVLFRFDPDGSLHRMIEGVTIPNGMAWTRDGKEMYFIDSPTKKVWKYRFDGATGEISGGREFFRVQEEDAVPDGLAMDVEGNLWVALCGGGKVVKVSSTGEKVGEVVLPTRMVTCPAFVRTELFVTSAREEESERFPESVEFGGSLFRVDVGVEGAPLHKHERQW